MPITANDLGPGTLTLGSGPLDVSSQLTGATITPAESVSTTDAVKVLSGETLGGSDSATYSYVFAGSFLQDNEVGGVVAFTWANEGEEVPFTYTPNTDNGTEVTGIVVIVPLAIGADEVDAGPMASDFSWRCVGKPVPTFAP